MKFLKRSVSVVLAFLMIFGSMTILASAQLGDGQQNTVSFDTKFYRNVNGEWVETTKAARGEALKVRVKLNTDFVMGSSTIFWLYSKKNLILNPTGYSSGVGTGSYVVNSNITLKGDFICKDSSDYGDSLIEYGYLPEGVFDTNGYILLTIYSGTATKLVKDDWTFEYDFNVADDATGSAQFYFPASCLVTPDENTWDNPSNFAMCDDSNEGGRPQLYKYESFDLQMQWELYDQDEDSTLTFTNPVKFNAGEGTFANGASEYTTGEGFIGEALSAADMPAAVTAPGGKAFVGWVPSTVDLATATAADCVDVSTIKYNYDVDTYNALYETTAATTFNFFFDPNGGAFADGATDAKTVTVNEGETVTAPVPTRVGYEFKGWALSTIENPTVDDVVDLPTAASGDASYKAVWAKSLYTVKWIVDGKTVREDSVAYGDALPDAPPVVEKEGNDFAWSTAPETMPAADVEIIGTYTAKTYTVTWKVGDDFSTTTEVKYGEALVAPEYTPAEGYDFEWVDVPATMPADDALVITGKLTAKTYKVTWMVNGYEVGQTEVKYGDVIADYELTVPEGNTFSGWTDKPDTMPASDITVNGTLTVNTYKITWMVDGEIVGVTEFKYDDPIVQYNYTVPEGYTFGGWTEYPQFMPANDLTISGTLIANTYNVKWKVDGEVVGTTTETFGQPIADYAYEAPEGYTFNGWIDKPETMPANENLVINGTRTANTYKVTWKVDGEVVGTTDATFGQPIADYDYEVPEGKTFSGWLDKPFIMPASDITVNGTLSTDIYNVTWKVNGEVVGTTRVAYGSAISDYGYNAPVGYTFNGWLDKPETMPASDITVNGTTTIKTYTVVWKINGGDYATTEVKYGEVIQAPAYTIPEGHSFSWGDIPATMPDNDNLVIYGTLTIRQFTITYYLDEAEKVVYYTETIDYGTAPTAQAAPSIKGKSFVDWDSDVPAALTEDVKLHAIFTDIEYTVVFEGPEGTLLDWVVTYEDSIDAITADDAEVIGYTFTGVWNYNGTAATFPTTAKALLGDDDAATTLKFVGVYDINVYHITFYKSEEDKANGIVLFESDYEFGTDIADAVADPTMEGYTFLGWDHDPSIVEDDDEFVGQWDVNTYTVTWKVGDDFSTTTEVKYGEALVAPEYTPAEGYDFEWVDVPATMPADDALVITGKLTAKTYKVTWNVNGEKVGETEVKYGEAIADFDYTAPDGFTFSGWTDKPATMPASDITVNGTTVANGYTVTWVVNGETVGTSVVAYGAAIADFDYTAPEGYTFGGWTDKPETMPANDITVNGTITANTYKVTWTVNGEKVSETEVKYGEAIADYDYTAPEGYTFSGWTDKPETMPANDITVNGTTTANTYKVSWFVNGEKVGETDVKYGEAIDDYYYVASEGYTFTGWIDKPDTMPASDIVVNGTTIANTYTIKFVDGEGNEVSSDELAYGSDLVAPSITVPEGMTLVGWVDSDGEEFTGKVPAKDTTYRPQIVSNNDVPYAIDIYLENVNGEYELSATTSLIGTTGQRVSAAAGEVTGFTFNAAESTLTATVAGDGSTRLVLKYSRNVYTATFDGEEHEVRYGAQLPDVTPADRVGMEFIGWVDANGDKAPATMPAGDLTLVSEWKAIEYTITYIVNGQKTVETYKYGDTVVAPADPVVDNMTFTGWSMEIPKTMPAENLVIIASFEGAGTVDAYTVTFWADGVEYDSALVKVGSVITLPKKAPTKEFYVFKGWKDVPATMPANDIDIYAEFERVPVTLIPKAGSTTVIDRDNMVIYGLQERMTEATYNSYLDVEGDGRFTVTATSNGFGTGTVVELYDNVTGELLETYHVVIFGDLNGDSRVNATDVSLATDEVLSVTNWSLKQTYVNGALVDNPDYKVYMTIAADLNGDGRIDSIDTSIISNRALALAAIDQVTGRATEA